MSRKIFAIEISQRAVSAVLVKSRIKGNWIEDHARVLLEESSGFEIEVARALEKIAGQIEFSGAVCVVALPAAFVSFRNLSVPFKEVKKIRQILPFELETTLPYAPEDMVADFHRLDLKDGRDTSRILAGALEKERMAFFLDLLKNYGIDPEIVTVSGFAVSQCLNRFSQASGNQLLLNIDEHRTTMTLNQSGDVLSVRSFAERATDEAGMRAIAAKVRQTLSALEETMAIAYEIEDVRLSGSVSREPMVVKAIENILEMPATPLDMMAHSGMVSLNSSAEEWRAAEMDGALSLALAEISGLDVLNFRQGLFAVQKAWVEHKKDLLKTGILASVILAMFLANSVLDYYAIKRKAERIQGEIVALFQATFPEVTKIVDPVHQMRLKLEEIRTGDADPEARERTLDAVDILNDISRFIPKEINVALGSIIIGSDSVLISGDTDTFNAVDDMKSGLEQAEAFKSVSISSANMEKSGDKVRFKLKVTL